MRINLWFSSGSQNWRWTMTDSRKPGLMESGQSPDLHVAMKDVAKTVEWLTKDEQPLIIDESL